MTDDPKAPRPRQSLLLPVLIPVILLVGIGIVLWGFSRLLLIALTCIEVLLSYSSLSGTKLVVALFACTIIKFVLVVGYFMHLKFDNGRFSRVFALGAIGAFTLYAVVLLMFRVWSS